MELLTSFVLNMHVVYTMFINKYNFKLTLLWWHNDSPILIRVLNVFFNKITHIHHPNVTSWVFHLHLIFQNDSAAALTLCLITPIKRVDFFVMHFVSNKHDWECSVCCRLRLMQGFNSACNYSFGRHFSLRVSLPWSEESWWVGRTLEKQGFRGLSASWGLDADLLERERVCLSAKDGRSHSLVIQTHKNVIMVLNRTQ